MRSRTAGSLEALFAGCRASLNELYVRIGDQLQPHDACAQSLRYIIRLIAVMLAAQRIPPGRSASDPLKRAAESIFADPEFYDEICEQAYRITNLDIFRPCGNFSLDADTPGVIAHLILNSNNIPVEYIFFETMPLSWLGGIYQDLLTFKPDKATSKLQANRSHRKKSGVFFTPPSLINYIVEGVFEHFIKGRSGLFAENVQAPRVLDPAMGGGDFLTGAINYLGADEKSRAQIASECIFGVDVDPYAVEIARYGVWLSTGFAEGIIDNLKANLICADTLAQSRDGAEFDWHVAFREAFAAGGFDAVIGNPPYIASKNGLGPARTSGQSDSYLMFISEIMDKKLVRPGGYFSMALPDPLLVRENAADVRRRLVEEWSMVSLLHISGAFPDAMVANAAPICRNSTNAEPTFPAARIDKTADRNSFIARPRRTAAELAVPVRTATITAQERCEFLYLLEQGSFGSIIKRIHGEEVDLSQYIEPFAPLRELNVKTIFRGEEVGKSAIMSESGDQPILLGGQSIRPYEINWEGCKVRTSWVRKPVVRYHSSKILIQKSSVHVIAALDRVSGRHKGYIFPQSVYAIELEPPGMDMFYLLCLLNSGVINEYIHRTVTGYKLLQPQLEIEDLRALPIRRVSFTTPVSVREIDLARGIEIFERESLRVGEFPELTNYVVTCLTGFPEKSDVVHDLLVYLGRQMMILLRTGRKSPDAESTRRLQMTRAAIEAVVWRLYSSEAAQMALPW